MTDDVKRIEVDIGAAAAMLEASPELCEMMNRMVGGPALVEAQAEIERLRAVVLDLAEKANAGFRGDQDEGDVLCYINNTARAALAINT